MEDNLQDNLTTQQIPVDLFDLEYASQNSLHMGTNCKQTSKTFRELFSLTQCENMEILDLDITKNMIENTLLPEIKNIVKNNKTMLIVFESDDEEVEKLLSQMYTDYNIYYTTKSWSGGFFSNFRTHIDGFYRHEKRKKMLETNQINNTRDKKALERLIKNKNAKNAGIINLRRMPDLVVIMKTSKATYVEKGTKVMYKEPSLNNILKECEITKSNFFALCDSDTSERYIQKFLPNMIPCNTTSSTSLLYVLEILKYHIDKTFQVTAKERTSPKFGSEFKFNSSQNNNKLKVDGDVQFFGSGNHNVKQKISQFRSQSRPWLSYGAVKNIMKSKQDNKSNDNKQNNK